MIEARAGSILSRVLLGLREGAGRTVVFAGPPESGKSELIRRYRAACQDSGARVLEAQGSYRERGMSAAIAGRLAAAFAEGGSTEQSNDPISLHEVPAWAMSTPLPPPAMSSRERGSLSAGRRTSTISAEEFWDQVMDREGDRRPGSLVLAVDDAGLADAESREFLLTLAARARFGPIVLLLALDTTLPSNRAWEETLQGRSDVDWLKLDRSRPDPREIAPFRELLRRFPPEGLAIARALALLGGSERPLTLGRIIGLRPAQLADALHGMEQAGVLRTREDRVTFGRDSTLPAVLESLNDEDRRQLHGRIADALQALHPEPTIAQRLAISEHIAERDRGPPTVRFLSETASVLADEGRFDLAEELLSKAIACASTLATGARLLLEAPLRIARVRALIFSGRLPEAERELREGVNLALQAQLPADRIEELTEPLLPALRLAGPRPQLLSELVELSERLDNAGARGCAIHLLSVLVEAQLAAGQPEKARQESIRVSRIARRNPGAPAQALALLTAAAPLTDGTEEERNIAAKCLRSARAMLAASRRPVLQLYADELHARRLSLRGERSAALAFYERAVTTAERAKLPDAELFHRLGIGSLLVDEVSDGRAERALTRTRELADRLRLVPPSPALLRLALLEGRAHARKEESGPARLRWDFVGRLSAAPPLPLQAEAWLRLADLELRDQNLSRARKYLQRLDDPEMLRELPLAWAPWLAELRSRAQRSFDESGGR